MKMWIKTPYPGEKPGEGVWTECTTNWMRRMWHFTNLPKAKAENQPHPDYMGD